MPVKPRRWRTAAKLALELGRLHTASKPLLTPRRWRRAGKLPVKPRRWRYRYIFAKARQRLSKHIAALAKSVTAAPVQ